MRRTQFNWAITGSAAALDIVLNLLLVPRYGIHGAAAAAVSAFALMFAAMALYAQRIYPVPYQWRRVLTLLAVAVGLTVAGRVVDRLDVAILLILAYPLVLLPAGFYLPAERARLARALVRHA
jgi:O-antigen/teichoic acid export membrane protein